MTPYVCPHGRTFDPAKTSCEECDATPAPIEPIQPGEGELAVAAAAARGLPDGLEVERLTWQAFTAARREAREARALAAMCIKRGQLHLEADILDTITEDAARRWFAQAAAFKQTVAKALDVQSKLIKLGAVTVQVRERIAAADRADREQARGRR